MDNKKRMNKKARILLIIVSAILSVAIIAGAITGIVLWRKNAKLTESQGPVIMEYGDSNIRLKFYEFMLTRMKGELYKQKYDVYSDDFWSEMHSSGQTMEEYYNKSILENCKIYLACLEIFDELLESGEISGLPKAYTDRIEEDIQLYIDLGYIGGGSEEKFNEILSEYGIDIDTYREFLTIEAKMQYVQTYLYGGSEATKIDGGVKEEFYQGNYYRFKHILIGNFYYKYLCDEFGNKMYFDGDTGLTLYDYENGEKRYDENGEYIKDEYGVPIAFDKLTDMYVYDTENGSTRFITEESGEVKKFMYTEEEMAERYAEAEKILGISKGDFASFEKDGKENNFVTDYDNRFESSDGIYMSILESGQYSGYMPKLLEKVQGMDVGEIGMVEADDGYHIIMRYELDEGGYSKDGYSEWFEAFNASLVTKLFLEKCQSYFDKMDINTDIIGTGKSIKDVGVNTDY